MKELSYIGNNLATEGYDLLINSSIQGDSLEALKNFVSKSVVDGMIIKAPCVDDERIKYLVANNIPFVVHGHDLSDAQYAFYDIDNASVAQQSVNLLHQLGHSRICFINADEKLAFAELRSQGFRFKINELALSAEQCEIFRCPASVQAGHKLALELLSRKQRATAIICSNSKVAYGVYMAANELHLKIGSDLSVIAHDDGITDFDAREFSPPMTVTCAPFTESSKPLVEALTQLITGADVATLQTVASVDLIVRESTGKPTI